MNKMGTSVKRWEARRNQKVVLELKWTVPEMKILLGILKSRRRQSANMVRSEELKEKRLKSQKAISGIS